MASVDRVGEVVRNFEQAILSGQLAPGDLLPPERTISADLNVSRSVVREALGRLASMGLVRSIHGSGTRVEPPSPRPIADGYQRLLRQGHLDLAHLAQVRLPLETAIAALAARNRTDEQLLRLEKTQEVLGSAGNLDDHIRADLDFHAILAEASGNPLFGLVLAPMQELLIESRRHTIGRHGSQLAYEHHALILDAVRAGDPVAAETAMRQHLQTNVEHLSERQESSITPEPPSESQAAPTPEPASERQQAPTPEPPSESQQASAPERANERQQASALELPNERQAPPMPQPPRERQEVAASTPPSESQGS